MRAGQASGLSGEALKAFREEATKLSRTLGVEFAVGAEEVSAGLLALTKAGVSAEDSAQAIGAALSLAKLANIDTTQAVQVLALAMNAFNIPASEAVSIVDALVVADDLAITSFEDLIGGFLMAAGPAKQFGLTLEETLGVLVQVSNQQKSAAIGGTALARALDGLVKRQDELGDLLFDAEGNFRPFVDILADVQRNLEGMNTEMERSDYLGSVFTEIRARKLADSIFDIRDASDTGFGDMVGKINAVNDAVGSADSRIEELQGTTQFAMDEMGAAWEELSIQIGEVVAGPLADFMRDLSNIIQMLTGLKTFEEVAGEARKERIAETRKTQAGESVDVFSWFWNLLGLGPQGGTAKWLRENVPGFQRGGIMPYTGLAHLEAGEIVMPAGRGAGTISVSKIEMHFPQQVNARRIVDEFLWILDQEVARR